MHHRTLFHLLVLATALVPCASASAARPITLLSAELRTREVTLHSISGNDLRFFDEDRTLRTEKLADFLQIRFSSRNDDAATPATAPRTNAVEPNLEASDEKPPVRMFVDLTDGQRLLCIWRAAENDGQALRYQLDGVNINGLVTLDDILALRFHRDVQFTANIEEDEIVLANGDRMRGFVLALHQDAIEFQPVVNGSDLPVAHLPLDRLGGVQLANQPKANGGRTHRIWLRSGMRLSATALIADTGMGLVTINAPLPGIETELVFTVAAVERIDIASAHGRLMALSDLPHRVVSGGEVFGRPWLPRIAGLSVQLHAPIVLEYDLPTGASRLSADAHLDVPEGSGATTGFPEWADFKLDITNAGESFTHHFTLASPDAEVNIPLHGGILSITLDEAANGPVMDRLRLDNAVLLVKQD